MERFSLLKNINILIKPKISVLLKGYAYYHFKLPIKKRIYSAYRNYVNLLFFFL